MRKPNLLRVVLSLGLGLGLGVSGCQALEPASIESTSLAPTSTQTAPTLDSVTLPFTTESPELVPLNPDEVVLTVWTAASLVPSTDAPGGQELLEQLATFDEAHPDIRVEVYPKRIRGAGGILAYLRSAPPVAPGILPDIALLDREALFQAAREKLVVPLEPLLDPTTQSDFYPVAIRVGTVDGTLVGLPYLLELQHNVYRDTILQVPPSSFDAILDSPVGWVFPAGTLGSVNHALLLQYMAAGGTLVDDQGVPFLDVVALRQVLTFYDEALENDVVDPALFQLTDPGESWSMYRSGQASLALVTSTQYLAERSLVRNAGHAWIATPDGNPYALATGWSWVVVTQDPTRQAAAMSLLNFLVNPTNHGMYSQAAGWLPTQRAALDVWGGSDRYVTFGNQLLDNAQPMPDTGTLTSVGAAIQGAFEAVILNNELPAQAATRAAQSVNTSPDG